MNWYYALGGQQNGPVDDAQLDALLSAGTLNGETLVWREGLPAWQLLRQARPGNALPSMPAPLAPPVAATEPGATPPGPDDVQCAECGRRFTRDNVIEYGTASVCAGCKPVFLQRLREGAAPSLAYAGVVNEEQLLAREYRIDIGDCLSRGWKLFSENAGIIIGTALLVGGLCLVLGMIVGFLGVGAQIISPTVSQFVMPFLNQGLFALIGGPMAGGYFWFLLKLIRGEQAGIGDAFEGFTRRFGQLVLCAAVQGFVQLLCTAPMLILMAVSGLDASLQGGGGMPNFTPALAGGFVGALLLAVVGMVYFGTIWTHAYLLIMDKHYNFRSALGLSFRLVQKRWWMTWVLLLVGGIIGGAGVIACCVGVIVTFPLYLAMRVWFYEDNFRDLAKAPERA